jgi:hemerythrin
MSILGLHKRNIPDHIKLPPELVTGVGAIDDEHRLLIAQLDSLHKVHDQTLDSEVMGEFAYVIGQTLLAHFKSEEEIMKRSKMPVDEILGHTEEHSRIIEEYVALQAHMMKNPQTKVHDIVQLVESWIIDHIANFDVPIKNYV